MSDLIVAHLKRCAQRGFSARTVTDRGEVLRRVDRDLPYGLEQATVEELGDWLARGAQDHAWTPQTLATYYGHIRGFFRWACDPRNPLLDYDPSSALDRPRVPATTPRPVSTAEVAIALAQLADPWRLYVLLAAYAGLRCCEIAVLRREDIDEHNITVRGKGGKTATVPTHPMIWDSVRRLPRGPIAWPVGGSPPTSNYISAAVAVSLRRIGMEGATMHRFRHWLGTQSLRAPGGNLRKTQELLRHASPATTAIYTQVTDEERRLIIHALPVPAATS